MGDDDFDLTQTVTVCLDDDLKDGEAAQLNGAFDDIQTPSTSDYVLLVNPQIRISQIPQPISKVLQLRLNPPAVGSMRNWEYIAALMGWHIKSIECYKFFVGMSLDEISILRHQPNPMGQLLDNFADTYFNQLLDSIANVNRIDVLVSLRPHLKHISANLVERRRQVGLATMMQNHSLRTPAQPTPLQQLPSRFILVTHYEPPAPPNQDQQPDPNQMATLETTDSGLSVSNPSRRRKVTPEQKQFKYLFKNMQTWSEKHNLPVYDIDKCLDESNTMQSLEMFFNQATHILLVATKAYQEVVCNSKEPSLDSTVDLKRQLAEFMQMEYMKNGRLNERFRVVVLDAADKKYLPMGWPSATIVYTFPENHTDLANRLFGENK